MKILICKDYLSIGGITTYIMHLRQALEKGNEVHLICTHFKGDYFDKAKDKFQSANALERNLGFFSRFIKIFKIIKYINPDVIFLNHSPLINMLLPFIAKKIRIISVIHSDDVSYYKQGSFFDQWIDKYICPSPKLKNILNNKYSISKSKIKVIPHGIKLAERSDKKRENSIIFIGNLDIHKGCDILIPVFRKIFDKIPSARLNIVGQGPYLEIIKSQINEVQYLKNKVKLIPKINPDKVYILLRKMEVLLFPTKLESFGYVIPEAMTNEVIPVVSLLEGVTDQFVINGSSGYLCDPDCVSCFSERIIKILMDNEKANFAKRAKKFVDENFSYFIFSNNYIFLLNDSNYSKQVTGFNYLFCYYVSLLKVIRFKLQ